MEDSSVLAIEVMGTAELTRGSGLISARLEFLRVGGIFFQEDKRELVLVGDAKVSVRRSVALPNFLLLFFLKGE
jgi:hypothetical protein